MELPADPIPVVKLAESDAPPPAATSPAATLNEHPAFDRHREINSRRAQLENPELLRRLRSL